MMKKILISLVALGLAISSPSAMADSHEESETGTGETETGGAETGDAAAADEGPGTQVGVRLLTHFSKKFKDSDWGIGGWVIMPDVVRLGSSPLVLVGPRYNGGGWWVEVMAGGLTPVGLVEQPAGHSTTSFVQSTRFQFTPKAFGDSPINLFGNLQFVDIGGKNDADESTMFTYTFLMVDYVLPNKVALLGLETENYFGLTNPQSGEKFNDLAFGPQVVLPFDGLNILMSYQIHTHENKENMIWFRAMYNFGGPK